METILAHKSKHIQTSEISEVMASLKEVARETGLTLDFNYVGKLHLADLGLDIFIKNADCSGCCSTNCSGCSACSGCSGCSSTSTSAKFSGMDEIINPDPISRFLTDLRDPAVQAMLDNVTTAMRE